MCAFLLALYLALGKRRSELVLLGGAAGAHPAVLGHYTLDLVDHAIETTVQRARQLDLVLRGSRRECKRQVVRLHERVVLDVLRRNRENYRRLTCPGSPRRRSRNAGPNTTCCRCCSILVTRCASSASATA
jgi:hypothetical protein